MLRSIVFIVLTFVIPLYSGWYRDSYALKKIALDSFYYEGNIVTKVKGIKKYDGVLMLFYSKDKAIVTLADLAKCKLFHVDTGEREKYYSYTPHANGTYYFAAALAMAQKRSTQNYNFMISQRSVNITNIDETGTNYEYNRKLEFTYAEFNSLTNELVQTLGKKGYFNNELTEPGLSMVNKMIRDIDVLLLEVKGFNDSDRKYTDTEVYGYIFRYTGLTAELEKVYLLFMNYRYRWQHLVNVNKRYLALTIEIKRIHQKAISGLKAKVKKISDELDYQ